MLRILHTNDFHGKLDDARESALAALRKKVDLYFDCGDAIKAGNLAVPLKPDPAWSRFASLDCTASVPGNRESHPLDGPFKAKLAGLAHPLLCANLVRRSKAPNPLPPSLTVKVGETRVGVVGVMVQMVKKGMATAAASQFLWTDPIQAASQEAERLRPKVDCLIALTHIGLSQDRKLAAKCPVFDVILGGHSHSVLETPEMVGSVAICQTGSHGRFAGTFTWTPKKGVANYRLIPLS